MKGVFRLFVACMIIMSGSSLLEAASVVVNAKVDQTTVSLSDKFEYTVIVSGEDNAVAGPVKLPVLTGKFNVAGSYESSMISWMNGRTSRIVKKKYVLVPVKVGTFVIGPTVVQVNNRSFKTNSISIKVVAPKKGTGATSAAPGVSGRKPPVFLKAVPSKKSVYVGEELIYRVFLYQSERLWRNPTIHLPDFSGVWVESLENESGASMQSVGGVRYAVQEFIRRSLFPLEPGELILNPVKADVLLYSLRGNQIIESDAVKVQVKPLPVQGKPKNFSGVVGEFSLAASLDQTSVKQHTPLAVRIVLSGSGNLRNITQLNVVEDADFKVYPSKTEDNISLRDGVKGSRTFEYIVVPKVSGKQVVPIFRFSYFSTVSGSYKTLKTEPFKITVIPNKEAVPSSVQGEEDVQLVKKELKYIKFPAQFRSGFSWKWVWIGAGLNGVVFLGIAGWGVGRILARWGGPGVRRRHALDQALRSHRRFFKEIKTNPNVLTQVQSNVLGFLSEKTGGSFLGLSNDQMLDALAELGLGEDERKAVMEMLDRLSFMIYAPSQHSDADRLVLMEQIEDRLKTLKAWKMSGERKT